MHRIINFILKYKDYLSFATLIIISILLITAGGTSRIGAFRTLVIGGVGWLQDIFSFIPDPGALESENESLRKLNLQLSNEVTRMRKAMLENKNLRETLGFREKIQDPYLLSEITGKSTKFMKTYLTIDKGSEDGVEEGMAVRTESGLVGYILGTGNHYSIVDLIDNPGSVISARVEGKYIEGTLEWSSSSKFKMNYVSKNSGVEIGDKVLTSFFSSKYPEGIPVGEIEEIEEDPGGIHLIIIVKTFVNFSTIQQLFVLKYLPDPDLQNLIKEMDKKLEARQKPAKP